MSLDKSPRQNRVKEALGKIYDQQQPPYFREYARRFEQDPTSRVFAPLAESYRKLGRLDEAIEVCREGLEHHPDFHGGRITLARCLLDRSELREAKEHLERVVNVVPENLLAQRLLGETLFNLGEKEKSLHAFKMALLLAPGDVDLSEKIHALERGEPQAAPRLEAFTEFAPVTRESALDAILSDGVLGTPEMAEEVDFPDLEVREGPKMPSGVLDEFLEDDSAEEDGYRSGNLSEVFNHPQSKKEITTETLGDLYFSQGQFDKALLIFEKLKSPANQTVSRKLQVCRTRLGVSREAIIKKQKEEFLRGILKRLRSS